MVVQEGVCYGDVVGGVGYVEEAVVVVFVVGHVGGEVAVVDLGSIRGAKGSDGVELGGAYPDIGAGLDSNGIAICG